MRPGALSPPAWVPHTEPWTCRGESRGEREPAGRRRGVSGASPAATWDERGLTPSRMGLPQVGHVAGGAVAGQLGVDRRPACPPGAPSRAGCRSAEGQAWRAHSWVSLAAAPDRRSPGQGHPLAGPSRRRTSHVGIQAEPLSSRRNMQRGGGRHLGSGTPGWAMAPVMMRPGKLSHRLVLGSSLPQNHLHIILISEASIVSALTPTRQCQCPGKA